MMIRERRSPLAYGFLLILITSICLLCCGKSRIDKEIKRLSSNDPKERAYAAVYLGNLGKRAKRAVPHLIGNLGDNYRLKWDNPRISFKDSGTPTSPGLEAAKALAKIGKVAVEPLTTALEDKSQRVRRDAAFALEKMGEPAAPALIAALKSEDVFIRKTAVNGLIKMEMPTVVNPLITCLHDKDYEIRRKAVKALGKMRDKRAVQPLIQALINEKSGVQKEAGEALKQIEDPRARDALEEALLHKDAEVRCGAILALGGGYARDNPGIIMPYVKDKHASVRAETAKVLGWHLKGAHHALVMKSLMSVLDDQDAKVRKNAVISMQYSNESDRSGAINSLKKALNDSELIVRKAAISSLEHLAVYDKSPQAIKALGMALKDQDPQNRCAAIWALARIKDDQVCNMICLALKDSDQTVRYKAVQALGDIQKPCCEDSLMAVLRDRDDSLRACAAKALGKRKSPKAIKPLIERLNDPEIHVRINAIGALKNIDDTQAVEPLIDLLRKNKLSTNKNYREISWIEKTLKSLTGKTVWDVEKFEEWWKEERKKK
jgi:HEAT repeat protein